jgi:hypothetical protein
MYEHLTGLEEIVIETRRLLNEIALKTVRREFRSKGGTMTASYMFEADHPEIEILRENLQKLYYDNGIGYKLLSSMLGNVSYTQLRTIFTKAGIKGRTGTHCVTDGLKKVRSERARKSNPWKDWPGNASLSQMHRKSKRYLGGWYLNHKAGKYVWLRSSWEFGYARHLDKQGKDWDVEARSYLLSDGRYYRPDFFVYENGCLVEVIEIKSTWSNGAMDRIEKFEAFKREYPQISARLVSDELFGLIGKTPSQNLLEWKHSRIMEKTDV